MFVLCEFSGSGWEDGQTVLGSPRGCGYYSAIVLTFVPKSANKKTEFVEKKSQL